MTYLRPFWRRGMHTKSTSRCHSFSYTPPLISKSAPALGMVEAFPCDLDCQVPQWGCISWRQVIVFSHSEASFPPDSWCTPQTAISFKGSMVSLVFLLSSSVEKIPAWISAHDFVFPSGRSMWTMPPICHLGKKETKISKIKNKECILLLILYK